MDSSPETEVQDTEHRAADPSRVLVLDCEFDASSEAVWRAVSDPELRERWLPTKDLADAEPLRVVPGEEIRYRMREEAPPFLESVVTFRLSPGAAGGTRLMIVHDLTDLRLARSAVTPANSNCHTVMLAA